MLAAVLLINLGFLGWTLGAAFQSPHSLLSIKWNDARSAHFVPGNFLITSFMNFSSIPSRKKASRSFAEGRADTSDFSICHRISAERYIASPANGEDRKSVV